MPASDSKNEKKKNLLKWPNEVEQAFRQLRNIFISISFIIHYDFLKRNRVKIDVSNFAVAGIFNQQNKNDNWHSMMFWSRKMILAKQNYKIYDQELLIIVAAFKQWRHYLKNNSYSIEILSDHNNLKKLMTKKELNSRQVRWAQILAAYDFEIFHRSSNKNSADGSSKRFDYEKILSLKITLLSMLQNKLTLSSNKESLTRSERKNSIKITFVLQLTEMSIRFDAKLAKLTRNKRNILTELALMFKLIDIQIIISRKVINDVFDDSYEKSKKFMKFLIKKLQTKDQWMKKIHFKESAPSCRLRKRFQKWIINDESLIKRNECLYIFDDAIVKKEFIKKHYNDSLSEHFEA